VSKPIWFQSREEEEEGFISFDGGFKASSLLESSNWPQN